MEEISNRLAISLLIIVMLTTMVTTFAFFHLEQNISSSEGYVVDQSSTGSSVSIKIKDDTAGAKPATGGPGAVSININK